MGWLVHVRLLKTPVDVALAANLVAFAAKVLHQFQCAAGTKPSCSCHFSVMLHLHFATAADDGLDSAAAAGRHGRMPLHRQRASVRVCSGRVCRCRRQAQQPAERQPRGRGRAASWAERHGSIFFS